MLIALQMRSNNFKYQMNELRGDKKRKSTDIKVGDDKYVEKQKLLKI